MSQNHKLDVPHYEEAEDEKLMTLYIQGDEVAFRELFLRYKRRVYGYLTKRVSETTEIDDLFQAVFLNLHRSRRLYDPKRVFSAWVFSITRNIVRDHLRHKRRTATVAEVDVETISGNDEAASAQMELEAALKSVSPRQREAIQLRFDKNLEFEEIAKLLGTSEENVRQIVSRAMRRIRGAFR